MKDLKKKVTRPRKRVIAILLSALMVLSVVLPSGGSGVRYNAFAEGEGAVIAGSIDLASPGDADAYDNTDAGLNSKEPQSVSEDDISAEEITESQTEEFDSSTEETTEGMTSEEESTDELEELEEEENIVMASSSTNLAEYVSDADAQTGVTYNSNTNTWSGINLNNEYEFTIYFTENQIRQFIDTDETMRYTIPEGIVANNINSTYIDLVYNLGGSTDTIKVADNPFSIIDGVIYFNFNTSDANFGTLKNSDDARFHLTFKGKFDGSQDLINFGNGVTRNVETNTAKDVTVEKSSNGTISADSDTINYTVKVKSSGYNEGITFNDALDNNYFDIIDVTSVVKDSYGNTVTGINVTETSSSASAVSYNIDKLYNGYYVEFNYKVRAKDNDKSNIVTADSNNDGRVTIGNTASVTCSTESDTSNNSVSTTKDISYTSISNKSAAVTDEENGIVTWTITLNPERIVSLNGKSLSDTLNDDLNTINDNQKFYSDITIKGYADNSTGSGTADVEHTVSKPTGSSFDYTFNENDASKAYYYVITYQTQAQNMDEQIADMKLSNTATFENYGSKTATATIGIPDRNELGIEKTATEVTSEYVIWTVTVDVPDIGLDSLVLTDVAPNESSYYYDDIVQSSISVTGLNQGEGYVSDFTTQLRGSDNTTITKGFSLTFHKTGGAPGLDAGTNRQIVLTYKTMVDQTWLAFSQTTGGSWAKNHNNTITATSDGINIPATGTATPVKPEVEKKLANKGTVDIDGTKYPLYEFQIRVAPVDSDSITITDTLPEGFKIYTEMPVTDWSRKTKAYGSNAVWSPETDLNQTITISDPDAEGNVTFTIPIIKNPNTDSYYNYYWLDYYIVPKDKATMLDLDQAALDTEEDKLTLTNTATYLGESTSLDFTYEPDKSDGYTLTKELVSENNGVAKYKIDVNPELLELNGGDNITLTDTFTNLSIDYSTIKVTAVSPADAEVISCDVRSNVMTIVLNDKAHYTIEYESNIIANGTYENVVKVQGYTAKKTASYSSSGGGDYGNQLSINIFKQEYGNALNKLEGVEFQLFVDENGTAVPVKDESGNIVTATTDENGKATFQGSNTAGWKIVKGNKYYIKELNPPEGYLGIEGMYNFTIADVPDWNNYVYKTGETMRVDNNKIDLKVTKTLDNAPDDLDLSTIVFTVVVSEGEGDNATVKTYTKTLAEIKAGVEEGSRWYSYDDTTKTYTWYFTDLTTDSNATVTETINASTADQNPSSISYSILNDGTATVAENNYTSGTGITVTGLANDSIRTVAFTNSYAGSVDVTPVVYKKLDGKTSGTGSALTFPLNGLSFDFSLYEISENLYPADHGAIDDLSGKWNSTASYTASASDLTGGKAEFSKITYNLGGAVTYPRYYYYKIVEDASGYSKITDDSDYVVMTVIVNKDSASGAITKSISYTKYNSDGSVDVSATTDPKAVAFNNITGDTTLILKANKYLTENGSSVTPDDVFSFKLEPVELNGVIDDQRNASQAAVSNNAANITFDALTYDGSDISEDSSNPTVYRYKRK